MSRITATELELLTFFEVQPVLLDPAHPWPYNDAEYRVSRDDETLLFRLSPAYRDTHIVLQRAGQTVYELEAEGLHDVRYHVDGERESLELVIAGESRLFLTLKPQVSIRQSTKRPT